MPTPVPVSAGPSHPPPAQRETLSAVARSRAAREGQRRGGSLQVRLGIICLGFTSFVVHHQQNRFPSRAAAAKT